MRPERAQREATDWQGVTVARPLADVIRMLLLTGQRLREVSEMRWFELDLENKVWSLPRQRCKNGQAHVIPLSDQAIAILKALKSAETAGLVFGVSGFSRA